MDNKQKEGSIKNYFESLIDEKLKIKGKTDINASGVVYYQIESGDFTATKKMVIIE